MSGRPFQTSTALTAMAVAWTNPDASYVADSVLPRVAVDGERFSWDYFPPEERLTIPDTRVGRKGYPAEVEFSAQQREDKVVDYGLDDFIPQSDVDQAASERRRNRAAYDPEASAVSGLMSLIKLDREKRTADFVSDPNNYDADKKLTLSGTDRWSDFANSDPIEQIVEAMDSTFMARPNIGVMGRKVFSVLRRHPMILKAINRNDGGSGIATAQAIAELFDLQELIIGDSYLNAARKGQPLQQQRVWGNMFALLHRNRTADTRNGLPTFGYTAELRNLGGTSLVAGRIADAKRGLQGGQTIRVGERVKELIVAPAVGYLFDSVIVES